MRTLGQKNRNPLNIRYDPANKWLGLRGQNKGFCVFSTSQLGYRAALMLLRNYIRKGYKSISQIIQRWAPENENNTQAYIDTVCQRLHYAPDYEIEKQLDLCLLCSAMAFVESQTLANISELYHLCDKYNIKL